MTEEKLICPRCSSSLVAEFCNMKRCQQCGCQFDVEKDPISRRAQRAKDEAGPSTGFAPHQHGRS